MSDIENKQFIKMYRVKELDRIIGYGFVSPYDNADEAAIEEAEKLNLSFEPIATVDDFIKEDRKTIQVVFGNEKQALAFMQGVKMATFRGNNHVVTFAQQSDADSSVLILMDFLDNSDFSFGYIDFRLEGENSFTHYIEEDADDNGLEGTDDAGTSPIIITGAH